MVDKPSLVWSGTGGAGDRHRQLIFRAITSVHRLTQNLEGDQQTV